MSAVSIGVFLAELKHAAGSGAGHIASSVTAAGNIEAKTGLSGFRGPGPALRSVLATQRNTAEAASNTNEANLPAIASHMAADALTQGADLLAGRNR